MNTLTHLRIPAQFKPERKIEDAPFYPWVKLAMHWVPSLKKADLQATEADLKLISLLAYQNDDLANELAREIMRNGLLANQLEQGLAEGMQSLNNPPDILVRYLEYYEKLPEFLSDFAPVDEATKRKTQNQFDTAVLLKIFGDALITSVGFFIGANYPAVGKSIVTTGSVAGGSERMKQTLKFVEDISKPDSFEKYGAGIQACAKVRLAHAFARIQIERKGDWDEDYYGLPISEFDNMIFLSGVFMLIMLEVGGENPYASKNVKGVQYGLGAPTELLQLSTWEIFRFFNMTLAHLDDSPETARQVVKNFYENEYFRSTETTLGKANRELTLALANLTSRMLYGNAMANNIGLSKWYRGVYLPAPAIFFRTFSGLGIYLSKQEQITRMFALATKLIVKASSKGKLFKALGDDSKKQQGYTGSIGIFKGNK